MSNGLAISGVTAVLQFYLGNAYTGPGSPFTNPPKVSCLAPDLVQGALGSGSEAENQVNLFLHQVTHNSGWRNVDLPSVGADGATRLKSPPLALDLHYLLTVYGSDYWQAEALLGYALMMLHENPVFARNDITYAFTQLAQTPQPYPGPLAPYLGSSGLADQIEMIKITPATLGREEMAWLWTALKADYRPTFPFQVSVVLMQPQQPSNFALPVLQRQIQALPIQPVQILQVLPPGGQIAAASTDTVTVTGEALAAVSQVSLSNPRLGVPYVVPVSGATNTSFAFVPNQTLLHPAGIYSLTAQITDQTGVVAQSTNALPLAVAPTLPAQIATVTANPEGRLVQVNFSPNASEHQSVALALSTIPPPNPPNPIFSMSAPAQPFNGSVGTLSFQFPPGLPSGALLGRLVVDGVPSQVQVDWTAHPPVFTGPLVTIP